jgi:hypothetical protein
MTTTQQTTSPETRSFEQGQRDAAANIPMIARDVWEAYTGPMPDSIWNAYCDGRGVSAK